LSLLGDVAGPMYALLELQVHY